VIEAGLATWANGEKEHLIIRGQGNLLEDVAAAADLERIRQLFEVLETRETLVKLLDAATGAAGVQIFIGAENGLFRHSGCSVVISPYMNAEAKIVGAIGVIGPTRINYARIIPMVDYTAKVIGRLIA
jgi:heat-inducible transcriptional repressor